MASAGWTIASTFISAGNLIVSIVNTGNGIRQHFKVNKRQTIDEERQYRRMEEGLNVAAFNAENQAARHEAQLNALNSQIAALTSQLNHQEMELGEMRNWFNIHGLELTLVDAERARMATSYEGFQAP
ncbi:hypothetical protein N7540_011790 [Penicillium herquei]|nr:hypothetical protein N7540_011790 [Penicillium herquei]